MTKVCSVHVECCRECPNAEDHPGMRRVKFCVALGKKVKADEIDKECPLDDETWEQED